MPFLRLTVASAELQPAARERLHSGLTQLMAGTLRKQAGLTVVAIEQVPPAGWSAGGAALDSQAWSAQLEVFITAGTNSAEERSRFIAEAQALICAQQARPTGAPLYVVIHEVPADSWGYDGQTQAGRRAAPVPQTLKTLAGAPAPVGPTPKGSALLLIDFQHEYLDGRLPLDGIEAAAAQAARLVTAADAAGVPVIHVHHEARQADAPLFAPGSCGAAPLAALPLAAHHHRIVKRMPSSFHGTELAELLARLDAKALVLAGAMTHNCVDSTAREALHRGFAVSVAGDACATRDLPGAAGGVLAAREVQACALAALADRHADVFSSAEIASGWAATQTAQPAVALPGLALAGALADVFR